MRHVVCVVEWCKVRVHGADQRCFEHHVRHELHLINTKLNRVLGLELSDLRRDKQIMATQQEFTDILTGAREDLANIAADEARQTAKIEELQAAIDAGGMTAEQEDAARNELQKFKDELKAAADAIPE